jgi:hypothetical protein
MWEQRVHLLNKDTAFTITANGDDVETVEEHIRRFQNKNPARPRFVTSFHTQSDAGRFS